MFAEESREHQDGAVKGMEMLPVYIAGPNGVGGEEPSLPERRIAPEADRPVALRMPPAETEPNDALQARVDAERVGALTGDAAGTRPNTLVWVHNLDRVLLRCGAGRRGWLGRMRAPGRGFPRAVQGPLILGPWKWYE